MTQSRRARAVRSLRGLALGDAFGEQFFFLAPQQLVEGFLRRTPPPGRWRWTDDTAMALSILEVLDTHGAIDPDRLAAAFARRFAEEPKRGYGGGAKRMLRAVADGADWRTEAAGMFGGTGSLGNGAAMRVAPLGAWFADDLAAVVAQATLSARVTHMHPDGVAGAVAVAVAAALLVRGVHDPRELLDGVLDHVPEGRTHTGIRTARRLLDGDPARASKTLGAGEQATAQDTVPFTLWSAARHVHDYETAMWETAVAGGDCDTTCAIVGGLVSLSDPRPLPDGLLAKQEALPQWVEAMDKNALRRRMRRVRREAATADAADASAGVLLAHADELVGPLGLFHPLPHELSTLPLADALHARGVELALPTVVAEAEPLVFRRWVPGDPLDRGAFGVLAPSASSPVVSPRTLVVPLLAFDDRGGRLGYGGGYYDRTIAALRPHVFTIGWGLEAQRVDVVPMEPTDARLDAVVTEARWRRIG